MKISHCGDIHVEEDRYFEDTAQCLQRFVEDSIRGNTNLFVVDGDLTTCKATIKERNLWVDILIRMANHAPVILVAGNHGAELEGDLYVLARVRAKHPIYLCTYPDFIELGEGAAAVFPYPRKAAMADDNQNLRVAREHLRHFRLTYDCQLGPLFKLDIAGQFRAWLEGIAETAPKDLPAWLEQVEKSASECRGGLTA
jgi:hypothetical protein